MSTVATSEVHAVVDRAAAQLLDAAGPDGVVSRKDIRTKLLSLEGAERDLVEALYQFIDRREDKRSSRMTRKTVESALSYVRTELVDRFDLDRNGLSEEEVSRMSELGKLAVSLARSLKGATGSKGEPLAKRLEQLSKGLFFDGCFGTEGGEPLHPFFAAAKLPQLTQDTLRSTLGLSNTREHQIVRFEPADKALRAITQTHRDMPEETQATELVELMKSHLREIHAAVLGKDSDEEPVDHPVYIVGLDSAGNLAGLKTRVIWT